MKTDAAEIDVSSTAWCPPKRRFVDVPSLVSTEGEPRFHVARDTEHLQGQERFFFMDSGIFRLSRGQLVKLETSTETSATLPSVVEIVMDDLPISGRHQGQLSVDERFAVVSDENHLYVTQRGQHAYQHAQLNANITQVTLLPNGILIFSQDGLLSLLEPYTLLTQWSLTDSCRGPAAVSESRVYVIPCTPKNDRHESELLQLDAATGAVLRRTQLLGTPVGPVVQDGSQLSFLAESWAAVPPKGQPSVIVEQVDLSTGLQSSVLTGAAGSGYGSFEGTLAVVVDAAGRRTGQVLGLRGKSQLLFIDNQGTMDELVTLPLFRGIDFSNHVVQLGEQLYLSHDREVWVISPRMKAVLGKIHFDQTIGRLRAVAGSLIVESSDSFYRLVPGGAALPQHPRITLSPWQFGTPEWATDDNPSTVWEFPGQQSKLSFDFGTSVVISRIALQLAPPAPSRSPGASAVPAIPRIQSGTAQIRYTRFDGHETYPQQVTLDAAPGLQVLSKDIWVTSKVALDLTLSCAVPSAPCRVRIAEVTIE